MSKAFVNVKFWRPFLDVRRICKVKILELFPRC
jgi:hypothetical protein